MILDSKDTKYLLLNHKRCFQFELLQPLKICYKYAGGYIFRHSSDNIAFHKIV